MHCSGGFTSNVLLVVEKVVGHVIAGVSKNATAIRSQSCRPVPKNDGVCKLPERCGESDEQGRRHDKPVFVHGEVVVNAVKEEMQGEANAVIWQISILVSIGRHSKGSIRTHPNGTNSGEVRIR